MGITPPVRGGQGGGHNRRNGNLYLLSPPWERVGRGGKNPTQAAGVARPQAAGGPGLGTTPQKGRRTEEQKAHPPLPNPPPRRGEGTKDDLGPGNRARLKAMMRLIPTLYPPQKAIDPANTMTMEKVAELMNAFASEHGIAGPVTLPAA